MTRPLLKRLAPLALVLMGVSGCQQSGVDGVVETILFAPPPYAGRTIPSTYNTPYSCPSFKKNHTSGWKGIIGGRKYDFDNSFVVSGAGCFETRKECEAYLIGMSPYVSFQTYRRCEAF